PPDCSDPLQLLAAAVEVDHAWLFAAAVGGDLDRHAARLAAVTFALLRAAHAFVHRNLSAGLAHLVRHGRHRILLLKCDGPGMSGPLHDSQAGWWDMATSLTAVATSSTDG